MFILIFTLNFRIDCYRHRYMIPDAVQEETFRAAFVQLRVVTIFVAKDIYVALCLVFQEDD